MLYNQQTSTTTQICLSETSTGFCAEWLNNTETTYNWFDTLALFLLPITMIVVIGFFKRKK